MTDIEHYPELPPGADQGLCDEFFGGMEHTEKKLFADHHGGENFYCMCYFLLPHNCHILHRNSGENLGLFVGISSDIR